MQLGQLITSKQYRDAIHIAVVPAEAGMSLKPGDRIKQIDGKFMKATPFYAIGIVDPFLIDPVKKGDKFWLFMMPHSITTIRHVWCHPGIPDEEGTNTDSDYATLATAAETCGKSYHALIADMTEHAQGGDWVYDNSERYKDVENWNDIWKAWERTTGFKAPDDAWGPYACAC